MRIGSISCTLLLPSHSETERQKTSETNSWTLDIVLLATQKSRNAGTPAVVWGVARLDFSAQEMRGLGDKTNDLLSSSPARCIVLSTFTEFCGYQLFGYKFQGLGE